MGQTLFNWLKSNTSHDVKVYDPQKGFSDDLKACDVYFIAVPVNTKHFKQDKTHIHEAMFHVDQSALVFMRSSVIPGTCDKLSIEYNCNVVPMPEFLTERRAQEDFDSMPILSGEGNGSHDIREILSKVFQGKKRLMLMKNKEAEMSKYAHNLFGLARVNMANCFYDLCRDEGIDYEQVRRGFLMSGHIQPTHTEVPGPDNEKGFGGKCFPTNLEAMIGYVGTKAMYKLLTDIYCLNRFHRGLKNVDTSGLSDTAISEQDVFGSVAELQKTNPVAGSKELPRGSNQVVSTKTQSNHSNIREDKKEPGRELATGGSIPMHESLENLY